MRTSTSENLKGPAALPSWAGETGWESDIVLSTRARLARNLADFPFPSRASDAELKAVAAQALSAARRREKGVASLRPVAMAKLSAQERAALLDSHLISFQQATAGPHRWALVDDRHTVSVMVNEEDHLRIQAILPGLQPDAAYHIADRLDDLFAARLKYATHPTYGYLTSSLGNCGTGLRVSVMVHLPSLSLAGKLPAALTATRALGASVRGLYGEDSGGAAGDAYQISNAVSTGRSERQLCVRLASVATYLVSEEQAARELLWRQGRSVIEDAVGVAQANLDLADRLSSEKALSILSVLRLGAQLGLPTGVTNRTFNELLVSMRLGAQMVSGKKAHYTFYEETRRPALIRNKIRELKREPRSR